MRRIGTFLFLTVVISVLALGCGKEDKGGKSGGGEAAKAGGGSKASGFETVTKEFESDLGKVTVEVPKGWQEQAIGEASFIFHAPGGGFHNSNFWVSATCQGACSSIAKNLEERAKSQIESFGSTYTDYETAKDEALPEGGRVIHVKMKLEGKPAHLYERYLYKEGWPLAAMCSATLINDQAKLLDTAIGLCEGMKVEPKAQ